ncbi:hypothetical protein A1OE_523 [Candidatus Endolissoclinum faulkneri L2]|uniref:Uncharacterized protein n=1 Tax=Candidatus Endolissoclinum faulkneri L2 TaxID=1193729 RepID=K7ZCM1_9PROT|nr:hypothetical protein A1OE_523 [Candidatus Endolissoclinum faulkneri L2]
MIIFMILSSIPTMTNIHYCNNNANLVRCFLHLFSTLKLKVHTLN